MTDVCTAMGSNVNSFSVADFGSPLLKCGDPWSMLTLPVTPRSPASPTAFTPAILPTTLPSSVAAPLITSPTIPPKKKIDNTDSLAFVANPGSQKTGGTVTGKNASHPQSDGVHIVQPLSSIGPKAKGVDPRIEVARSLLGIVKQQHNRDVVQVEAKPAIHQSPIVANKLLPPQQPVVPPKQLTPGTSAAQQATPLTGTDSAAATHLNPNPSNPISKSLGLCLLVAAENHNKAPTPPTPPQAIRPNIRANSHPTVALPVAPSPLLIPSTASRGVPVPPFATAAGRHSEKLMAALHNLVAMGAAPSPASQMAMLVDQYGPEAVQQLLMMMNTTSGSAQSTPAAVVIPPNILNLGCYDTEGPRCDHVGFWKRLRAKRGYTYFVCRWCERKWRIRSDTLYMTCPSNSAAAGPYQFNQCYGAGASPGTPTTVLSDHSSSGLTPPGSQQEL